MTDRLREDETTCPGDMNDFDYVQLLRHRLKGTRAENLELTRSNGELRQRLIEEREKNAEVIDELDRTRMSLNHVRAELDEARKDSKRLDYWFNSNFCFEDREHIDAAMKEKRDG